MVNGTFDRELVTKGLIEALGAFILVHSFCATAPVAVTTTVGDSTVTALTDGADDFGRALVIGLTYMLLTGGLKIYANPAITFAKAFGGTMAWLDSFWYFICAIAGAFGGTVMMNIMYNADSSTSAMAAIFGSSGTPAANMGTILYFEGFYSAVICLITLLGDDATTEEDEGHNSATAIASAYTVGNYLFGSKTGGIFNPSIALGNAVASWARGAPVSSFTFLWVHIAAPYAGAFVAAVLLWLGSPKYGIFWDKKADA